MKAALFTRPDGSDPENKHTVLSVLDGLKGYRYVIDETPSDAVVNRLIAAAIDDLVYHDGAKGLKAAHDLHANLELQRAAANKPSGT